MEIKEAEKIWNDGIAKTITFIVTKDCQLACKYCYLVGKNTNEKMTLEIAKKAVDYILSNKTIFKEEAVVFDFIGGEPFLEIELIDKICDYIKISMFDMNHPWFNSYRFSFSTNGILYGNERVQNFIKKNLSHIDIGITIDGTKQKHDLQRVYPNGKGSYNDVVKNIPLWLIQFPDAGTKVTIGRDDLKHIADSVLHLYSLGIKDVNINVVFENIWKENDDIIFEEQLNILADAIISNDLYSKNYCSFFSRTIGIPLKNNHNWCGAGKMLSIDSSGNFYPCTRFAGYSLRNKTPIIIGNIYEGINLNKLRPFLTLNRLLQSPQECLNCEVASGCAWCQGENYDSADTPTIFQRSTAICKMHKARVRANNYFWSKLDKKVNNDGDQSK